MVMIIMMLMIILVMIMSSVCGWFNWLISDFINCISQIMWMNFTEFLFKCQPNVHAFHVFINKNQIFSPVNLWPCFCISLTMPNAFLWLCTLYLSDYVHYISLNISSVFHLVISTVFHLVLTNSLLCKLWVIKPWLCGFGTHLPFASSCFRR